MTKPLSYIIMATVLAFRYTSYFGTLVNLV